MLRRCSTAKLDAFTFVEVFAAMVFLAILIPAVVEGLTIANRASVIAERSAIASQLAENKISEVEMAITSGSTSDPHGDFGSDWPGYTWDLDEESWDQDGTNTMTQLAIRVSYPVQGKQRSLTLTTLVSGTAATQSSL